MSSTAGTTSVSPSAISKAKLLLLEDFRLGNSYNQSQTIDPIPMVFEQLGKRAQELELILEAFSYHVRHEIAHLRRQQNAFAPIHRFPAEIFKHIFLLVVSDHYSSFVETPFTPSKPHTDIKDTPMTRATSSIPRETGYSLTNTMATVCSHWYHVSLSTPQLWSYLDSRHHPDVTKVLLQRSRNVPLHISCPANVDSSHERQFMELVIPDLYRWKSFYTDSEDPAWLMDSDAGDYSAPLLESLISHKKPHFPRAIKRPLVLARYPGLRDLHIAYPLRANALSGLRNLSIWDAIGRRQFSMKDYELILSSSPKLEMLFLRSERGNPLQISLFSVKLPNLKSIYFHNLDPETANALLASIFPDPGTYPSINVVGQLDVTCLSEAASDLNRSGSLLDLTLRSITDFSVSVVRFGTWPYNIQIRRVLNGALVPSLDLTSEAYGDLEEVVVSLVSLDGKSMLKSFEVELHDRLLGSSLGENIHRSPHLEHITVVIPSLKWTPQATKFIKKLSPLRREEGLSLGPQLKQLSFKGVEVLDFVLEIFRPQNGRTVPWILARLSILDLHYIMGSAAETDEEAKQEVISVMASRGIQLNMIPDLT